MPTNVDVLRKVVDHIRISDAIADLAGKQAETKVASDKRIAEKIPAVVATLIDKNLLPAEYSEKCAAALADHEKALEIIVNAANMKSRNEMNPIGAPSGKTKTASARGGLNSPYCGGRHNEERDSDRVLFEKLGLR